MMKLRLSLLLLPALLAACSNNVKPPPPPEDIVPSIAVKPRWVYQTGTPIKGQHSQLPPALGGDNIYVANANGILASLKSSSGSEQWLRKYRQIEFSSGVGLGEDILAVGTRKGQLIAFDRNDGRLRWESALSSEVLAAPLVLDEIVIAQTIDSKVYALDRASGKHVWAYEQPLPSLTLRGTSSPRIAGDKVLVAFASGMLAALDIKTGEAVWETAVATPSGRNDLERIVDSDGEFLVDKNMVYIATFQGRVAAINLQDGAIIWARDMSSYAGLTASDSQVLVSDAESNLWALDRTSGATLWRQDKLIGRDITAPVLMDGMIVVGDRGGYVHWLSAEDGHFLARARLEHAYGKRGPTSWIMGYPTAAPRDPVVTATPLAGERALYVHDDAGVLTMYRVPVSAAP